MLQVRLRISLILSLPSHLQQHVITSSFAEAPMLMQLLLRCFRELINQKVT